MPEYQMLTAKLEKSLHSVQPHRLEHPIWQWFARFTLAKVEVPTDFFQNGQFMGLHELNQRAVRVFDVAETPSGFAHVETVVAVNSEGVAIFLTKLLHGSHSCDVEAEVDIPKVAPKTVLKNLAGVAVFHLDELYLIASQQFGKSSLMWFTVPKQNPPHGFVASRQTSQVFEAASFIINHLVEAQYFFVKNQRFVNIGNAKHTAENAAHRAFALRKPAITLHDFNQVAVGIVEEKMLLTSWVSGDFSEYLRPFLYQKLMRCSHIS